MPWTASEFFISPGDYYEEMQELAKTKGYEFEYLYDESQAVAKQYGATNTPHVGKRGSAVIIHAIKQA